MVITYCYLSVEAVPATAVGKGSYYRRRYAESTVEPPIDDGESAYALSLTLKNQWSSSIWSIAHGSFCNMDIAGAAYFLDHGNDAAQINYVWDLLYRNWVWELVLSLIRSQHQKQRGAYKDSSKKCFDDC